MRGLILLFAAVITVFTASAQNITIKNIELAGPKVIVHYDLDDSSPTNEYLLSLYSSKDNFAAPLTKVTGDIGAEIKPGSGKRVEWDIVAEYGAYKGRISLEIRGRVFVPFVKLQNFDSKKSIKRGSSINLTWKPGNSDPVHIELFKGSQRVSGELNQPNSGAYTITVPASASPGNDYRIKFSDSKSNDYVVYSENFKVTPKIPLLLKVVPAVAVVAVLVVVLGGKKGGTTGGGGSGGTAIPDPPIPD